MTRNRKAKRSNAAVAASGEKPTKTAGASASRNAPGAGPVSEEDRTSSGQTTPAQTPQHSPSPVQVSGQISARPSRAPEGASSLSIAELAAIVARAAGRSQAPRAASSVPVSAPAAEPVSTVSDARPAAPADQQLPSRPASIDSDQEGIWISLDSVDDSTRFRLRDEGDVESLATSIVRSGQIFPILVRQMAGAEDRYEIVCGFRRVAALKLIMRRRVLAVIRKNLDDGEALDIALADLLEGKQADKSELEALKKRLQSERRLTPIIDESLTRLIAPEDLELSPETIDCASPEPDPCALVDRILSKLGSVNQDLSLLARCWDVIPRDVKEVVMQQLGYSSEMARYFRRLPGGLF